MTNPLKYFAELRDPRVERTREHLLEEILLMAIAAVLSGAGSWTEIEGYGKAKRLWFKGFLKLPGGIPSHDTFNRVISALDPAEMERGFADWVVSIAKLTTGEVVAIDGKTLCGTREAGKKTLVHMVSAWASANNLVLAQRKVDDKSNEITAIPKLLAALELSGTVVTIDAMGCQRERCSGRGDEPGGSVPRYRARRGIRCLLPGAWDREPVRAWSRRWRGRANRRVASCSGGLRRRVRAAE
jgi:predicted transposase YbfD/YdcC